MEGTKSRSNYQRKRLEKRVGEAERERVRLSNLVVGTRARVSIPREAQELKLSSHRLEGERGASFHQNLRFAHLVDL